MQRGGAINFCACHASIAALVVALGSASCSPNQYQVAGSQSRWEGPVREPEGETAPAEVGGKVYREMEGVWGWPDGSTSCANNPQTIQFSEDGSRMHIRHRNVVAKTALGRPSSTFEYVVEGVGNRLMRMRIVGETRLTADGVPVVWDFIVLSRDQFCWHRTDWPWRQCTKRLGRCPIVRDEGPVRPQ